MITGVRKIIVAVDDQDRAIDFWTRQIGFLLLSDQPYGEHRWIEVAPPDRSIVLVLSRRPAGEPRREVAQELPHSPVFFNCDDIERTYRELAERMVSVFRRRPSSMAIRLVGDV